MSPRVPRVVLTLLIVLIVFSIVSVGWAQDRQISYQLLNELNGNVAYELNVVVPQSLLDYYEDKRTDLRSSSFPDYVTPYALAPIADCLWQIYETDEEFANGVLMLVHQITYEETAPSKYPVETMVDGKGDCDLFSFIAASILEAGGIDVVLLHYETLSHMNIGVGLSSPPEYARDAVFYVTDDGVRYYIAECTGGNWKEGWRVGECPEDCKEASSRIYSLEGAEAVAPGQVSASFSSLDPSTMSLQISSFVVLQDSSVTVRGQISPGVANRDITIYSKFNLSTWTVIGTTATRSDGSFEYCWIAENAGLCMIQASCSGDDQYTGAISPTNNTIVIPLFVGVLIAIAIIAGFIAVIASVASRSRQNSPDSADQQVSAF
jgi:hypothetical protein